MNNEVRPYPGFSAMLEEFQDLFADWVLAGYPSADFVLPGGKHHQQQSGTWYNHDLYLNSSNSARIQIVAEYAKKPGFIFSSSTIDTSAVASFCQRNHLEYRIASYRDLPETLFIFGTPLYFLNSELSENFRQSRTWAQRVVPLAQKFYQWEPMKEIVAAFRASNCSMSQFYISQYGLGFRDLKDDDGHTWYGERIILFQDRGYRDLQTKDELVAFTLAFFSHVWRTKPHLVDWNKLFWNIRINEHLILNNMPRLDVHCPYTDPPLKPQPAPPQPTYKDFF